MGGRGSRLPKIRSGIGQTALSTPEAVDLIKEDMLEGRFDYERKGSRVFGWLDDRGTYYICEGHHRIVAALEICRDTGDRSFLDLLLVHGQWETTPPPKDRRLRTRSFWSRVLRFFDGW
jgi:hypothetical protein